MTATKTTDSERELTDILSREPFIQLILDILNTISDCNDSYTFALNGKWGVGKTFVLNQLKQKLETSDGCGNDGQKNEFVVFHYNCWRYDFYEEPLIAILSSMIDAMESPRTQQLKDFAAEARDKLTDTLVKVGKQFVFSRYGVDLSDLFGFIDSVEGMKEQAAEKAQQRMAFDPNYTLHKSIRDVREMLVEHSRGRTLVIIVDELDRCLPDYAIKVLERLHHLFHQLPNTAVILGIDKTQLEQSIRQIFGAETVADNYLRKIINFEITLDAGVVTDNLPSKFDPYFSLFDKDALQARFPEGNGIFDHSFNTTAFLSNLLTGIEARRQEQIINRCMTIHKILFGNQRKDYALLCAELAWVVMTEEYGYTKMPLEFRYSGDEQRFYVIDMDHPQEKSAPQPEEKPSEDSIKRAKFKEFFDDYLKDTTFRVLPPSHTPKDRVTFRFAKTIGIGELLIWYLSRMYVPHNATFGVYNYSANTPYVDEFRNLRNQTMHDLERFKTHLKLIT